jgi:acylglycerol lipase
MVNEKIIPKSIKIHLNDNTDMFVHLWTPTSKEVKGIVILYHGFLAHGLYPTVRYAAELLASTNQYIVMAPDLRGHGTSPGLQHYLPNRQTIIDDGICVVQYAQTTFPNSKIFLMGSSMGGTIALNVAQKLMNDSSLLLNGCTIAGVVLLAPMLQLSVSGPARTALWLLSYIVPTWQIIPSAASNAELQYRDPAKRKECEDDSPSLGKNSNSIRIASAFTCVDLASAIQDEFCNIVTPYLLLVADEDCVVNNEGDFKLYEQSPSTTDKTMKRYAALHGLLCEPSPLVDTIQNDILEWIRARS